MARLLIVIASTRPNRVGLPVGRWFEGVAREDGRFEIELVDLAELNLPFLNEPKHPRLQQYEHEHTRRWSATVDGADAIVFVTAEYNYGYPAPLKNAIDYLHNEWRHKPLGYVSYGGIAAGTRSVQQLKQVTQALGLVSTQILVNLAWVAKLIGEDGELRSDEGMEAAATSMLDELVALDGVLRILRGKTAD
ncbi:MAG TPA: NAD(P)H-dependent oxidoreductase [Solirubrobacteraceae bacterium]|nr:NAD(P)H-dependent oxidoreductase [Solirubrobacteraceae bacterium]